MGFIKQHIGEELDVSKYFSNGNTAAEGTIINKSGDGYNMIYQSGDISYKIYEQCIGSYCNKIYGNGRTISNYGCGPTAVSILASGYYSNVTPLTVINDCKSITDIHGVGAWDSVQRYLNHYGFNYKDGGSWASTINSSSQNEIINHLKSGKPVILLVHGTVSTDVGRGGPYTSHYITLLGINDKNKVFVGDPGSSWNHSYTTMDNLVNNAHPDKYFLVSR
ncbi:MAG: C39 family peptidase [Clostridia bacterium]|nr:C39 family peptidase [Clostridia bacterium]